jgi:hypothetical protein
MEYTLKEGSAGPHESLGVPEAGESGCTMRRIEYLKTDGGCPKRVAYDCDEDGSERFAEREVESEEWVSFVPSGSESGVARAIRKECQKPDGAVRWHHEHGTLMVDWIR